MRNKVKFFSLIIGVGMVTTLYVGQTFSQTKKVYNESWALLVGINKYKHLPPQSQLQFAVNDVMSVRQLLLEAFGFREDHIVMLIDEQATKHAIQDAMSQFANTKKIHENDRILIHFSGHGQTVKSPDGTQMGFLITHDAEIDLNDTTNIFHYYRTCLGMDELSRLSGLIPAKHVLFLIDACYSGAAIRTGRSLITPELPNYLEKVADQRARQIVVAGGSGEQVFEELGHGVFTFKLLEALKHSTADLNNDHVTTTTELGAYLKTKVMQESGGRQTPYFGRFKSDLEGEFIFQHPSKVQPPPIEDHEKPKIKILPRGSRAFAVEGIQENNQAVNKLIGLVTDNSTVQSVYVNDKEVPLQITKQGWRFEITIDTLAGSSEVKIKAIDAAGNVEVIYWKQEDANSLARPPAPTPHTPQPSPQRATIVDTESPEIIILEPEDWGASRSVTVKPTVSNDRINLVGIASDNIGVTQLEINRQQRIRRSVTQYNGKPALRFEYPIDMPDLEDIMEIEIYAADAALNSEVIRLTLKVDRPTLVQPPTQPTIEPVQPTIEPIQPTIEADERINPKDDAVMVYVPKGEFIMGISESQINALSQQFRNWDGAWFDDEKPQHHVYLEGYWIYKYEVTVAQYRKFCEKTGHKMPKAPSWGWQDDHPIVNVSWDDAAAYCQWAGVELPTEAQWEKAARGTDGRIWPWGNQWDSSKCNNRASAVGGTAPVGSYPSSASPYGVMDMAGNVWEWCADWYDKQYYRDCPSTNPQGPANGDNRVLRGGSWRSAPRYIRSTYREWGYPDDWNKFRGFRCVFR